MDHIYGISGLKSHGKDTLAKRIVETDSRFIILHFADELKRLAGEVYELTHDQMYKQAFKEVPLEEPIELDSKLAQLCDETKLDIQPAGMVAKTPREVLQFLGTEYVRKTQETYWVDVVVDQIRTHNGYALVPDTRFPNEAQALRDLGGQIILVHRLDLEIPPDTHASETEILKTSPDLYLGTITDRFSLQREVVSRIAADNFNPAKKLDYRRLHKALSEIQEGNLTAKEAAWLLGMPTEDFSAVHSYYEGRPLVSPAC